MFPHDFGEAGSSSVIELEQWVTGERAALRALEPRDSGAAGEKRGRRQCSGLFKAGMTMRTVEWGSGMGEGCATRQRMGRAPAGDKGAVPGR
jgi:hypothetical protein